MEIARAPRGMVDLFSSELAYWHRIEKAVQEIFPLYNFQEIRTPILEDLALFNRGVGASSDIVEKEMFLVKDGEHEYCLRPENTAPVVRALIERGGISTDTYDKYFYMGPMFRKERPQKGRLRQFHQFGAEIFGPENPEADLEIILLTHHLFQTLGLTKNITLRINSLGTMTERAQFKELLKQALMPHKDALCEDCKRRLETNPLRILDCKKDGCQIIKTYAPKTLDSLEQASKDHFQRIVDGLLLHKVPFEIDHQIVRGLDYYNRTVFEFQTDVGLGAQNAIAAGGRYDGLFTTLGNKIDVPAIGIGVGIERVILVMQAMECLMPEEHPTLALIGADDHGHKAAFDLALRLRQMRVSVDYCLVKKSVKAQMRRADKMKADFAIIIGENEIKNGRAVLKGLLTTRQEELPLDPQTIADALSNA